jgi:hypothetical protein
MSATGEQIEIADLPFYLEQRHRQPRRTYHWMKSLLTPNAS